LALVAFTVFSPAQGNGFVNLDDPIYVVQNPEVRPGLSWRGIQWAFTTFDAANWHPLTWLSLQLDATWSRKPDGELDPGGFHLTSVLLHAASTALLFLALRSLTVAVWRSAAVALLFAVHPLRVESVAWVAERKDVLSVFFGLLALWAYAEYARGPDVRRYLLVTAAFVASLLSKPMLVTLPFLLLVLDWWPLGRARTARDWLRLATEKLPLFALAAASSVVTYYAQKAGEAVRDLEHFSLPARAGNAACAYAAYLVKTVWPSGLSVFYPHPYYDFGSGSGRRVAEVAGSAVLLAALTAGAAAMRRRAPYLLAGWLWFLGTLVPVIGLVQVGKQAYADRYTYFPQIGLLLAVCWGVAALTRARPRVAAWAAAAAALALAGVTLVQLQTWKNSRSLWEHAFAAVGECPTVLFNRGEALEQEGHGEEAFKCYSDAVELDPNSSEARLNLGNALQLRKDLDAAAEQFEMVCVLSPNSAAGYSNLGNVYLQQGKFREAAAQFEIASRLPPRSALVFFNLGAAEEMQGNFSAAADHFREAVGLQPDHPRALAGLGINLARLGKKDEALARLREAERIRPAAVDEALGRLVAAKQRDLAEDLFARLRRGERGRAPTP
jgi:tetratricopeptide (TPR) repeat protein